MLVLLVFLLPAGDGGLKPKSPRTRCLGLRPLSDACGRCLRFAVRVPSRAFGYLLHPGLRLMDRLIMETQRHYRPNRIILVRHGESQGNVNKSLYTTTPDSQVQLTARGFEQGLAAGQQLRSIVGDESVCFLYSPYMRTRQTLLGILQSWRGRRVDFFAEPRLREQASHSVPKRLTHARARAQDTRRPRVLVRYARQDFGNFQDLQVMRRCYEERRRFGRIWYRFPSGEAGSDVYSRVGDLWGALRRRIDHPRDRPHRNLVLVTHGLLMRFFCMHYLGWTEHEFEQVWNPTNGEIWVLSKTPRNGRYRLSGRWDVESQRFLPIRFGPTQRQEPYPHMMEVSWGGGKTRDFVLPDDPTSLLQSRLRVPVPGGRETDDLFLRHDSDGDGLLDAEEFKRLVDELEGQGADETKGRLQTGRGGGAGGQMPGADELGSPFEN